MGLVVVPPRRCPSWAPEAVPMGSLSASRGVCSAMRKGAADAHSVGDCVPDLRSATLEKSHQQRTSGSSI